MKRCSCCGRHKPRSNFNKGKSWCRECQSEYRRAYYVAHREQALADARESYERQRQDPAFLAGKARKAREWRSADQERARESSRRGRQRWAARHPEAARLHSRRGHRQWRARRRDAFVEHVEPLVVLERDDGACGICGGDVDPSDFHVDHIVPLSRGGLHCYENAQPAHPSCNSRKQDKLEAS